MLCSLPEKPSIAWVRFSTMSLAPSVVGIMPSSAAASTIYWRWARSPIM